MIDLSYAAAVKLGITQRGTGRVEVRALTEADNAGLLARRNGGKLPAPARASTAVAAAAAKPAESSRIDELVKRLPEGTGTASNASTPTRSTVASPAAAVATVARATTLGKESEPWRYRVADAAQPGNADNFDAWMKAKGVRVATGKPAALSARPDTAPAASAPTASVGVATVVPASVGAAVARKVAEEVPTRAPSAAQAALGSILLQVASFASRENADRALTQLSTAGIPGASISDIVSGGRTMWRLRVNAPDHARASELATRIAGLGFGRPQVVAN